MGGCERNLEIFNWYNGFRCFIKKKKELILNQTLLAFHMLIGQTLTLMEDPLVDVVCLLVETWLHVEVRFNAEAEHRAMHSTYEVMWIKNLMGELGFSLENPMAM